MSKSSLCQRIELCGSIHRLNEDGCLQAIRLLSNILGYKTLNHFLISIVVKRDGILDSNNHLQDFDTQFNQLLSSNQNYNQKCDSCTSHSIKPAKEEEQQPQKALFPLLRLPIDIIKNTTLFLNETDIFKFEQCCRLFYTMINNKIYLNQSNNFKIFTIDSNRFEQLTQSQYSFFKYSKARRLEFDMSTNTYLADKPEAIDELFCNMDSEWDKIEKIRTNDGLFDNLFSSIKSLTFSKDGMTILGRIPLKILFGKDSQLETMKLNHYWNTYRIEQFSAMVKKFEDNYISVQNEIKKHGQEMVKLKFVEHTNGDGIHDSIGRLRCVVTDHLCLVSMVIDFDDIINTRVLTCKDNARFGTSNDNSAGTAERKIETLRLLDFNRYSCFDILKNRNIIQSFNLDKSCKNLLMQVDTGVWTVIHNSSEIENCLKSIFEKEYYYSLENVNLLFKLNRLHVHWIFTLLKRNVKILKHQFKQFNIGINVKIGDTDVYQTISPWNPSIDEKVLDETEILLQNQVGFFTPIQSDNCQHHSKYLCLLDQWS